MVLSAPEQVQAERLKLAWGCMGLRPYVLMKLKPWGEDPGQPIRLKTRAVKAKAGIIQP